MFLCWHGGYVSVRLSWRLPVAWPHFHQASGLNVQSYRYAGLAAAGVLWSLGLHARCLFE